MWERRTGNRRPPIEVSFFQPIEVSFFQLKCPTIIF
jgi:hypothetical protein